MIQLDFYGTLVAASLVLLLGRKLVAHTGVLRTYNIPEPAAWWWPPSCWRGASFPAWKSVSTPHCKPR